MKTKEEKLYDIVFTAVIEAQNGKIPTLILIDKVVKDIFALLEIER